MTRQN